MELVSLITSLVGIAIWLPVPNAESFVKPSLGARCYGRISDQNLLPYMIERFAVDSKGQRCYTPIDEDSSMGLLHKSTFEESYHKLENNFCPSWRGNKRCLSYHLKSNCIKSQRKQVKESVLLNVLILFAELVCEPVSTQRERLILKRAETLGLSSCVDNDFFQNATSNCSMQILADNKGRYPSFSEYISRNFECLKPQLEHCKEYSPTLAEIWEETRKAFRNASNSFWKTLE